MEVSTSVQLVTILKRISIWKDICVFLQPRLFGTILIPRPTQETQFHTCNLKCNCLSKASPPQWLPFSFLRPLGCKYLVLVRQDFWFPTTQTAPLKPHTIVNLGWAVTSSEPGLNHKVHSETPRLSAGSKLFSKHLLVLLCCLKQLK